MHVLTFDFSLASFYWELTGWCAHFAEVHASLLVKAFQWDLCVCVVHMSIYNSWLQCVYMQANTNVYTLSMSSYIHIYKHKWRLMHEWYRLTDTHVCLPTYIHTYMSTYIHSCMCLHIHIHIYMEACMHAHGHGWLCTYIQLYIHTYILHTYTFVHVCLHTNISTCIQHMYLFTETYMHA